MNQSRSTKSKYTDQNKLQILSDEVVGRIDELFDKLGVDVKRNRHMYVGACPVHSGDKENAFNFYQDGHTYKGFWKCRTHNCPRIFRPTLIGLVRGILSHQRLGWENEGDDIVSFNDTIDFLLAFSNQNYDNMRVDLEAVEKRNFTNQYNTIYNSKHGKVTTLITREMIRNTIAIPAQYYLNRNYKAETLDKYDVGLCTTLGKPMSGRVVVPVYDEDYKFMVGCTGRTIYPKCEKCKVFHREDDRCPSNEYKWLYSKWKHSPGFDAENHLYNYWFAKEHIASTGIAVLVESPGNVWRLEENNIHNSIGTFGACLNDGQKNLLDKSGAMSLIVIGDNDDAGKALAKDIYDKCSRTYRLYFPTIHDSDVAEMNADAITNDIQPFITQAKELFG